MTTKSLRIVIGTDHRGVSTAEFILETLKSSGYEVSLVQRCGSGPCDYPEQAYEVGLAITEGSAERGILICGTGIGMSIASNKIKGLRAALVHDELTAKLSRSHNDANVLCLSADLLGERLIDKIVHVWMSEEFEGGRHQRRLDKITEIEAGRDPRVVSAEPS
ncbi:MAG: ribose 5-phosphate isomerase B [Phycisphaerales bacterium]|nr:ribose 5-phosphate isomerase B [Phycisphaerales bacterium]